VAATSIPRRFGLKLGAEGREERYWDEHLGIGDQERKEKLEADYNAEPDTYGEEEELHTLAANLGEVRSLAKQDLDFLAGLAIPDVVTHTFPPILTSIWSLLQQYVERIYTSPKLAVGIPRGHGKTTLIKLFILYCILFTRTRFILIISSTEGHAVNIISDVVDMLNERNILSAFGDWKTGLETNQQALKKFGFMGRNIVIAAIGAGGSLRGLNLKNERPDLMLFDDVQTKEDSESPTVSTSLERWIIGTAMKARSPRGCLYVYLGNMYPGTNCILRKFKPNPQWIKFISGAILSDGSALWEALRSYKSLIEEFDNDIAMGHPEIFLSEVMNDTEVGSNTNVDLTQIKDWPWSDHEWPQGKFIIIDPSSNKLKGDMCAIGYFEVYDTIPGLRELVEERLSPGNIIRKALLMALEHRAKLIAVESTSFQYTLLYWFEQIATQLGIQGIQFVPIYTGSYSKNSRLNDAIKTLTQGELYLHRSLRMQVINQIVNWNPMKQNNIDDLLDLLSYAPKVIELYRSDIASDIEAFAVEEQNNSSGARVWENNSAF
jgi:hypothetical protein